MDRFSKFVRTLDEMARVKDDDKAYLPNELIDSFKHVAQQDPNGVLIRQWGITVDPGWTKNWIRATLMALFKPKYFQTEPAPTEFNEKIETSDGKKNQSKTVKFPVDIPALKAFLEEKRINLAKVDMQKQMAKTTSEKTMDFLTGKSQEPPFISAKQWQVGFTTRQERGEGDQYARGIFMSGVYDKWVANIDGTRYRLTVDGDPDSHQYAGEADRPKAQQAFEKLLAKHSDPRRMVDADDSQSAKAKVSELLDKGVLKLDADDMEYVNYFQTAKAQNVKNKDHEIPAVIFMRKAFQWRYSPKLLEDPQASQGGGKLFNLTFPYKGGYWTVKGVPVNAPRLRAKFEMLNDKFGLNFYEFTEGLPVSNAMRWLGRAGFKNSKGSLYRSQTSMDPTKLGGLRSALYHKKREQGFVDNAKFDAVQAFIRAQEEYLEDQADQPATDRDPSAGREFKYDVEWEDIIKQEAIIATNFAVRSMADKGNPDELQQINREEKSEQADGNLGPVSNLIYLYLLSDEAVGDGSKYGSQSYRLKAAKSKAMTEIARQLKGEDEDKRSTAIDREEERQKQQNAAAPGSSSADIQTDGTKRGGIVAVLKALQSAHGIGKGVPLEDLADKLLKWQASTDASPMAVMKQAQDWLHNPPDAADSQPLSIAADKPASNVGIDPSRKTVATSRSELPPPPAVKEKKPKPSRPIQPLIVPPKIEEPKEEPKKQKRPEDLVQGSLFMKKESRLREVYAPRYWKF